MISMWNWFAVGTIKPERNWFSSYYPCNATHKSLERSNIRNSFRWIAFPIISCISINFKYTRLVGFKAFFWLWKPKLLHPSKVNSFKLWVELVKFYFNPLQILIFEETELKVKLEWSSFKYRTEHIMRFNSRGEENPYEALVWSYLERVCTHGDGKYFE